MSIEGQRLLLQIDALLSNTTDSAVESDVEYSFEGPAVRKSVLSIMSVALKANRTIEPKLRKLLESKEIREKILNIQGTDSSTKDEIEERFVALLQGKKPKTPKNKATKEKLPALRTTRGRFFSLANLQVLLNKQLHDAIKDNMGKGDSKSLLNYRTGRFANTVYISRLTRTRDSTIEVFYKYMKYPYQTFEPGFKQGTPRSRDPRTLISKSIRDIAIKVVSERMKAISV
jgi:hypothetical protein